MHHTVFDMLDDFSQRLGCFDVVLGECRGLLEDPDSMLDTAHRALAHNALSQAIRDTGYHALARSTLGHLILPYLRGTVGHEPVGGYAAFALKAWPNAKQLREWRTVDKLINASDSPPRLNPPLIARVAKRKVKGRFREWRWKTAGM
jgi:hypothetical protein